MSKEFSWTEEKTAELKALCDKNYHIVSISQKIGIARKAITDECRRLGITVKRSRKYTIKADGAVQYSNLPNKKFLDLWNKYKCLNKVRKEAGVGHWRAKQLYRELVKPEPRPASCIND